MRKAKIIDIIAYVASFLSLFFTIDQVRVIWIDGATEGVSLISQIFYTFSACVWLAYGIIHKDRVLITTNFFWVLFSISIVTGILLHRP